MCKLKPSYDTQCNQFQIDLSEGKSTKQLRRLSMRPRCISTVSPEICCHKSVMLSYDVSKSPRMKVIKYVFGEEGQNRGQMDIMKKTFDYGRKKE